VVRKMRTNPLPFTRAEKLENTKRHQEKSKGLPETQLHFLSTRSRSRSAELVLPAPRK